MAQKLLVLHLRCLTLIFLIVRIRASPIHQLRTGMRFRQIRFPITFGIGDYASLSGDGVGVLSEAILV